MGEILEMMMVILFGISWPLNIIKAFKSKSTKGTSILFLFFVFFGYLCGIASKIINNNITYVFIFYIINTIMVGLTVILYFRNKHIEELENEKN